MFQFGEGHAAGAISVPGRSQSVTVPDAEALFQGSFDRVGANLLISGPHGEKFLIEGYFSTHQPPILTSPDGAVMTVDTVLSLVGDSMAGLLAQAAPGGGAAAIGRVDVLSGAANVQHANGASSALARGDHVFKGDVVSTQGIGSSLGIKFVDGTVFSLSANARMVLNDLVYSAGGSNNSMAANLIQGTFVFVAGQTAHTGDMKITTPVATMGIRGTTPSVTINANNGATTFSILPDPDTGRVGSYDLIEVLTGRFIRAVSESGRALVLASVGGTPLDRPYTVAEITNSQNLQSQIGSIYRSSLQSSPVDPQSTPQQPGQPNPNDRGQLAPEHSLIASFDSSLLEMERRAIDTAVLDRGAVQQTQVLTANDAVSRSPFVQVGPIMPETQTTLTVATAASLTLGTLNGGAVTENSQIVFFDLSQGQSGLTVTSVMVTTTSGAPVAAFLIGNELLVDPVQFKYLSTGESVTLNITYTATDGTATASTTGTLVVVGFNDNPIVAHVDNSGAQAPGNGAAVAATGNFFAGVIDIDGSGAPTLVSVTAASAQNAAAGSGGPLAIVAGASVTTAHGTLVYTPDGNYIYTPGDNLANHSIAKGSSASDTFTFVVQDSDGGQGTGAITFTIAGTNDSPIAVTDVATALAAGDHAAENAAGGVLGNDTDVDVGDVIHLTSIGGTALLAGATAPVVIQGVNGTLVMNPDGHYVFTPGGSTALTALGEGDSLTERFNYTIADGSNATSSSVLTIEIHGQNDGPVVVADVGSATAANAPAPATGNVLANDSDVDTGDSLTVSMANGVALDGSPVTISGAYGWLMISADGSYVFTPYAVPTLHTLGASGAVQEVFSYEVTDASGASATSDLTISLTIEELNNPPTAAPDAAVATATGIDAAIEATGNVLTNDIDTDPGDSLIVTSVNEVSIADGSLMLDGDYGTLTIAADGSYSYTPFDNETLHALGVGVSVDDVFQYVAEDQSGAATTEYLTITTVGQNDAPAAVADAGDAVAHGLQNANGFDATGDVLANDSDVDAGDSLSVESVNTIALVEGALTLNGSYGTLTMAEDGTYSYTPFDNEALRALGSDDSLQDVFSYAVIDGYGGSATTDLTITIHGQNDAPTPVCDVGDAIAAGVDPATPATGNVLENDTDPDNGDSLRIVTIGGTSIVGSTGPAFAVGEYGVVFMSEDGSYSYDPFENATLHALGANDSVDEVFSYQVADTFGATTTANLTITIQGQNDAPVGGDDSVAAAAGGWDIGECGPEFVAGVDPTGNVLTNDSDPDAGDTLTVTALNGLAFNVGASASNSYGSFEILPDGSYVFHVDAESADVLALTAGQSASFAYTVTITDSFGASVDTSVAISVDGANDRPVAVDDTSEALAEGIYAGAAATGDVLANDDDSDEGDYLDISSVSGAYIIEGSYHADGAHGALDLFTDGTFHYTPYDNAEMRALTQDQSVEDVFSYTVVDSSGLNSTANLSITISGQNDAPVATNDTAEATAAGDGPATDATGNLLVNDSDVDSGSHISISYIDSYSDALSGTEVTENPVTLQGGFGVLTLDADGTYTYATTDNAALRALGDGDTVDDVFSYLATDEHGATAGANLTITITGQNDIPVAFDDTGNATAVGDGAAVAAAGNLLDNDFDPDASDTFTLVFAESENYGSGNSWVSYPGESSTIDGIYGSFEISDTGAYNYTPFDDQTLRGLAQGEEIHDYFYYEIEDTHGEYSSAWLDITITGQNDAPVGVDDVLQATASGWVFAGEDPPEFVAGVDPSGNVLTNDSDVDTGDQLAVTKLDGVEIDGTASITTTWGTFTIASDGSYTFTVDPESPDVLALTSTQTYFGDPFTLTITDSYGASVETTVSFSITGGNDMPVANSETIHTLYYSTNETGLQIPYSAIQFNDYDPDNSGVFLNSIDAGLDSAYFGPGYVAYNLPSGSLSYVSQLDYTVSDGTGLVSDQTTSFIQTYGFTSVMTGTTGDDILITDNTAANELTGGQGRDVFVLTDNFAQGDTITDYTAGEDAIWLPVPAGAIEGNTLDDFVRVIDGVLEVNFGSASQASWVHTADVNGLAPTTNEVITILLDDSSSSLIGQIHAQFTA